MYRGRNFEKKIKAGKRFLLSFSCLILLSGIAACASFLLGKGISEKENPWGIKEKQIEMWEISGDWQRAGGFDNPIDGKYLALIYENAQKGENAGRLLAGYEETWRLQLKSYLEDYKMRCKHPEDQEMADEYLKAVSGAVSAQKDMMEYLGMEEEMQQWYSAQIYRCAFVKGIRGTFDEGAASAVSAGVSQSFGPDILPFICLEYGEFENEIDQKYVTAMYDGCEVEVRKRQEEFDLAWCNQLSLLTMEFYEGLDEEGRGLADVWQESRECWKKAFNSRLWRAPEELNDVPYEEACWGNGTRAGILEIDGWINRIYFLQLQKMTEKTGRVVCEA